MILLILETLNQKLISRKTEHAVDYPSWNFCSRHELSIKSSKNMKVMNKIILILLDNNIF